MIVYLSLSGSWLSSVQSTSEEDVETLLNGEEDEPRYEGTEIINDIIDPLLCKRQDSEHRHYITLSCNNDVIMMS